MCIYQTYKYRSINLINVSINLYEKSTRLYNLSLNISILNKLKKEKKRNWKKLIYRIKFINYL